MVFMLSRVVHMTDWKYHLHRTVCYQSTSVACVLCEMPATDN